MPDRLPQTVLPDRLAQSGTILRGRMALSGMKRLLPYLHEAQGTVEVELEFGIDLQGVKYLRGHLHSVPRLVCQRCMEPMDYPIDLDLTLGLVHSEAEAEYLPERYEPFVFDGPVVLQAIIEDELLLALPIVPLHEIDQCRVNPDYLVQEAPVADPGEERQRPFTGLARQLRERDKSGK